MKRILSAVGICAVMTLTAAAQDAKNFSIKGTITGISTPVEKVLINYRVGEQMVRDSAEVKDGRYVLTGKIPEPTLASMRIKYKPDTAGRPVRTVPPRDFATIFMVPATMDVQSVDSFANVTITGSPANDDYKKLTEMLKPEGEVYNRFGAAYTKANKEKDLEGKKAAEAKLDSMDVVMRNLYGKFLKANPQSPIAVFALTNYAGWDIDVQEVEPLYNKLIAAQKETPSAKSLQDKIGIAKKTSVGMMAMDFTQNDTLGMPVKLSSFRGKYVLVDFWASWCGPCRAENPNVVKTYQAYKDKNFTILGVSLDQPDAKQKWMDAIHADNLTWTHVSDLQYWQNAVAKQYGIQAIPQNLLLDPNGKIIARNLNGEKLEKKLAEVYGK